MIKENELRIGNWVKDLKTQSNVQIDGIHVSGRIYVEDNTYDDGKRSIEPDGIKITPEILKKCGFEITAPYNVYHSKLDGVYFGFRNGEIAATPKHCISLHQLQNIYFALTDIELEINLYVETNI